MPVAIKPQMSQEIEGWFRAGVRSISLNTHPSPLSPSSNVGTIGGGGDCGGARLPSSPWAPDCVIFEPSPHPLYEGGSLSQQFPSLPTLNLKGREAATSSSLRKQ